MHVLKCVLPKEVALQIIVKWYATRNAPGTQDISPELEWKLFSTVLFGKFYNLVTNYLLDYEKCLTFLKLQLLLFSPESLIHCRLHTLLQLLTI